MDVEGAEAVRKALSFTIENIRRARFDLTPTYRNKFVQEGGDKHETFPPEKGNPLTQQTSHVSRRQFILTAMAAGSKVQQASQTGN
jgi:hypothetical protein